MTFLFFLSFFQDVLVTMLHHYPHPDDTFASISQITTIVYLSFILTICPNYVYKSELCKFPAMPALNRFWKRGFCSKTTDKTTREDFVRQDFWFEKQFQKQFLSHVFFSISDPEHSTSINNFNTLLILFSLTLYDIISRKFK